MQQSLHPTHVENRKKISILDHSNVDKRVKDISEKYEIRSQPEHPVSRTPSFGKKKEEAALKQDEKENDETKVLLSHFWFTVSNS